MSHLPFLNCKVESKVCDVCHKSNQTRVPFPVGHNSATGVFDLFHIDVWGPYRVPTNSSARYMLTIMDDHSRVVWIFLMNNKAQVSSLLIRFFLYVNTQFHTSVKCIRSDNGSEFVGSPCQELFQSLGIVHK